MKAKDKKAVKKVYDFLTKTHYKDVKKTLDLGNGVKAKVEYALVFSGYDYSFEEDYKQAKLTYPKIFTDIMKLFGGVEDYNFPYELQVDTGLNEANAQLEELAEAADLTDEGEWLEFMIECDTFNEFWVTFEEEFEKPDAPKPVVIRLSNEYNAIIKKDSGIVEVGCQRIPIGIVRQIVTEYDAL